MSDWSSDVCSSDLPIAAGGARRLFLGVARHAGQHLPDPVGPLPDMDIVIGLIDRGAVGKARAMVAIIENRRVAREREVEEAGGDHLLTRQRVLKGQRV